MYLAEASDASLIEAHNAGDSDAFGELFRRHRDRLWAVALRTTGDPDEASDALQDAMVSAFRNSASFRGDSAITTWLHRIVVNACLDRLRRRKARPTVPIPTYEDGTDKDVAVDPRDDLANRELQMELKLALDTLPLEQRAAIVLVDVEGYPVEEVARILNCPTGTVKSRCARGRAKLAKQLAFVRNPDRDPNVLGEVAGHSDDQVTTARAGQQNDTGRSNEEATP